MEQKSAIVIGAGIVGLAIARALAIKGFSVTVFDKSEKAVGASVRNFGMIWPIGQPSGTLYNRAKRTKEIWTEIANETQIWHQHSGSLHLAYNEEEWQVLNELYAIFKAEGRDLFLINKNTIADNYTQVNTVNLIGGLYSTEEMLIDPREAVATLPKYLNEKYGVQFHWNSCVSYVTDNTVYIGNDLNYEADLIFVCSGIDFETLFPEEFKKLPITKCKLQMIRTAPMPIGFNLQTAICGGLSLLHYKSFKAAPSLFVLHSKMEEERKDYLHWGIHVMAAQNGLSEITIGDSHEYGLDMSPFDKVYINTLIMDYLKSFLKINDNDIAETWNGFYPKLTNGDTEIFLAITPNVFIINGLGGAGMTLSLGLAEELIEQIVN
jgi:FAD dependent oxidoreductase TIGR03364